MLTVDSFCRRAFAPRPTDMILYYLFIIIYSLFFLIPTPGPSPSIKNFPIFFAFPY